MGHVEAHTK